MASLDDKAYEQAVADRIKKYVFRVNCDPLFANSRLCEKLERAWALNVEGRKLDTENTLNIGADADYYFAARTIVATDHGLFSKFTDKDVKALPGSGIAPVDMILAPGALLSYDIWKRTKSLLGHPEEARTDKDRPNSQPFRKTAYVWEWRGARRGMLDDGQAVSNIVPYMKDD